MEKQTIIPSIWFDNNAEEAFLYYQSIFPNSSIKKSSPVVVEANLSGVNFIGINGGNMFQPNSSISFMLICETQEEIEHIWKNLQRNGKVLMSLDEYPWSKCYGWIIDRYHVSWQLYLGKLNDVNQQKIVPTLMFCGPQQGKCQDALNYYETIFPNFKQEGILKYDENFRPNQIQHSQFVANNFTMMAMDSGVDQDFTFTEGISLTITYKNQDEIDFYWNHFTKNGEESRCGWCKDKFGVSWQIVPENIGQLLQNPKAQEALMKMNKIIISDLI